MHLRKKSVSEISLAPFPLLAWGGSGWVRIDSPLRLPSTSTRRRSKMTIISMPGAAIVAFYLDGNGQVVASEFLRGVNGRQFPGQAWQAAPIVDDPEFDDIPLASSPVPDSAVLAVYLDAKSQVVATEVYNGAQQRVIQDLGAPIGDGGACAPRCTVQGPNGFYCLPGCH
jgi:hypothetical protein